MFNEIEMAVPDAILGLFEEFLADSNPNKINLGVGIYKDESGQTPIMSSVKKAEEKILQEETSKSYLPIPGSPGYGSAVQELLFGAGSKIISDKRAVTAQTPGGTGALRIAGEFLKKFYPDAKLWVSDPTWANHIGVFGDAGLEIKKYPYYDGDNKCVDIEAMLSALNGANAGDIVLLHGCCHNPTGMDPTIEQWEKIREVVSEKGLLPFFDFAYQGFAKGINEDAAGLRLFAESCKELVVASSYSKNFGLYNERVGAMTILCDNAQSAEKVISQVKVVIRRCYSNPPSHGGAIVTTIMNDKKLRFEWESEVKMIRQRMRKMRQLLVKTLKDKGAKGDFSYIEKQNGMFSYSGLSKEQVQKLRQEHSIYIVGSGRINVAGISTANVETLCEAIVSVL